MKHSMKRQLTAVFIGLMAIVLLAVWGIDRFFLERYYLSHKEDTMIRGYELMNTVDSGEGYESAELSAYNTENNMNIIVVDNTSPGANEIVYNTMKDNKHISAQLFGYETGLETKRGNLTTLVTTDNYVIQKNDDRFMNMEYLEMYGHLQNGYAFLIRMPLESIRESVNISNQFLAIIGVVVALAGGVAVWLMVRRYTKPITELTEISRKMTRLDFDAKYTSDHQGKNEIDVLGENFNRMSEELENTISELKTANNALQKDIEKKIQVDEMRKDFLANVSHELKTPIALIQGYAEGLKENINDDDPEGRNYYCDVIMDESGKMNTMVRKLMTLNQLEFGNDQVVMDRFDLAELIRGVLQSARLMIEQKEVRVIFEVREPVYVWGDEFKLEEVVTNYLTNALNHADGEKTIEIRIKNEGKIVRTSVFNTGDPIPEGDLDKVWTKFYKVDRARTREYGGSGIGLSIVKAIMDSMNQECGVKNYHNGVEFWFTLECDKGDTAETQTQAAAK